MEIQQARTFLAVAREGSFSRAARKLFRTQPTITMAIQKLERELGPKLFERSGHGVRLTAAGHVLLEAVGPLVEQWDGARSRLHESIDGVLRGPVQVGGGEGAILYLLPGPIRSLLKRHPRVEVIIRHQTTEETLAALREGELDFALSSLPSPPGDISSTVARRSDRMLIAPRNHPLHRAKTLTLEALSRYPFILPRSGSTTRKVIEGAFAERNLSLEISLEAGGWEIIKRYAGLGLGIAVLPAFCLEHADRRLAARSVRHLLGRETHGILARKGRDLSAAATALVKEIGSLPGR